MAATTRMTAQKAHVVAAALTALAVLFWAAAELLAALLSPGFSLFQVVWMRYGVHILVVVLAASPRGGLSVFRTQRPALQAGRGLLMLVMPASFIFAFGRARIDDVMAVFWLAPLALLAIAAAVRQERPRWFAWGATLAAVLGAELILRPSGHLGHAAVYGIGMGASFSLYVVLTRTLRVERTSTNLLYSALAVFVPLSFAMPFLWKAPNLRDGLVMVVIGLVGLGFLWALDRACALAPISTIAVVFPLQVVTSALAFPLLFAGDRPRRLALAGTALIFGAVAVAVHASRPRV